MDSCVLVACLRTSAVTSAVASAFTFTSAFSFAFSFAAWRASIVMAVFEEGDGIGVVFLDPFFYAGAFFLAEFAIAVFIELLEHGGFDFRTFFGDGFVGGFFLLFAEFSIFVGVEAFKHFGFDGFAALLHGGFEGGAFFFVEFAIAVFIEFLDDVLGWAMAFCAAASFPLGVSCHGECHCGGYSCY